MGITMESRLEEQEVYVYSLQHSIRPNGRKGVQVVFAFESPYAEIDKEKSDGKKTIAEISINPVGVFNKTTPEEIKLIVNFSQEEWKKVEKKYLFGSTHKIKIKPNGRVEGISLFSSTILTLGFTASYSGKTIF